MFQLAAVRRNWNVTKPIEDKNPFYDFLVDMGDGWKKVQVKTVGSQYDHQQGRTDDRRFSCQRGRYGNELYQEGDFDYAAAIDANTFEMWLVPFSVLRGRRAVRINKILAQYRSSVCDCLMKTTRATASTSENIPFDPPAPLFEQSESENAA